MSPAGDLAGEAPGAERGDDQLAARVGGIRLRMAAGQSVTSRSRSKSEPRALDDPPGSRLLASFRRNAHGLVRAWVNSLDPNLASFGDGLVIP
jgi:hypothetical protein